MGSPCQIRLKASSLPHAQALCAPLIQEAARFEAKYSRYLPSSLVSQINQSAGATHRLDAEAAAIIDYAAQLFVQSDGLFDITSGLLRKAWDFSSAQLPDAQAVQALLPSIGWQRVDWQNPILRLPPTMQIDLGGIVKEYAADALAQSAMAQGIHTGLIELGGDIRVFGEASWPLGISDPLQPNKPLFQLHLQAGGFATSGNYQRYFMYEGKRYSHILNPKTGWPVVTPAGVSVIADNCLIAGSVSTLALLMGEDKCLSWLYDLGLPFLCVFNDGRVVNEFVGGG
ncbi:MAG TPA: FAD:protein FMN transferase [Cellvibrionaceae bacterium]|nr:FAD:protein FMN transferase [Cellvibrionaceae bacterium]